MPRLILTALFSVLVVAAPATAAVQDDVGFAPHGASVPAATAPPDRINLQPYETRMEFIESSIDEFYAEQGYVAGYRWKAPVIEPATSRCTSVVDSARYCTADHSVSYDETFMRTAYERFGDAGAGIVMAHEFGHSMQDQLGLSEGLTTLEHELQADCLTGAWLGERTLDQVHPITTPEVIHAAKALFGDSMGDAAHGTGAQRRLAAQYGYTHYTEHTGVQPCLDSVHALPLL